VRFINASLRHLNNIQREYCKMRPNRSSSRCDVSLFDHRVLVPRARCTDGEAGFMDARRIVDRMFVAGLHPDWASVSSLLDTVSQDSRNGTCMIWQIDQVAINGPVP
jgi:hypothetical protein